MVCNSCQHNKTLDNNSKRIDPVQMKNMSFDGIIDLYRQGYQLYGSGIESLSIKDIGSMQYIWAGLFSYGAITSYKSKHEIWAIIFGGLALGSLGGIYTNYKK